MDTLLTVFVLQSKIELTYGSNRCTLVLTYTWAKVCTLRYFISILSGYIEIDHSSFGTLSAKQLWLKWWKSQKILPIRNKTWFSSLRRLLVCGVSTISNIESVFFLNCKIKKSAVCWTYRLFWKSSNYSKKASTIIFLVACKDIWNASKCQSGAAAPFEICKKRSLSVEH